MTKLRGLALVAFSVLGVALDAHAEDLTTAQCVSVNEHAQALRRGGELRAARTNLRRCVSRSCPGPVRVDCATRLDEVERAMPSLVFVAKDAKGADLVAVSVAMDGVVLTDQLDGSALSVDPGEHTFELTTKGASPVSTHLVLREGMKGRHELVVFGTPPQGVETPARQADAPTPAPEARDGSSQRLLGLIVGGAGIVGLGIGTYFGVRAKGTYDDASASANCPAGLSSCNQSGVDGNRTAHDQATVSTVAFVAGGALLAGGVVLFLTAPKDGSVRVQAGGLGASSAGLQLRGGW